MRMRFLTFSFIVRLFVLLIVISSCGNSSDDKWIYENSVGQEIILRKTIQQDKNIEDIENTKVIRETNNIDKKNTNLTVKSIKNRDEIDLEYQQGTKLLKTNWDQSYPFNMFFPKINNVRASVYCLNIALIQLMYYYKHPVKPTRGELSGRQFNWDIIPSDVSSKTRAYKREELASIFLNVAKVNKKSRGMDDFRGVFKMDTFIDNFGFSAGIMKMQKDANNFNKKFDDILINEIESKRPVIVRLTGGQHHLALIDGYMIRNEKPFFHLNMGLGGDGNGFYDLDQKIKLKEIIGDRISYRIYDGYEIYYQIEPCFGSTCFSSLEDGDVFENGNVLSGSLEREYDSDIWQDLFLSGTTRITVEKGNGFYIEIYDSGNKITHVAEGDFEIELPKGRYYIKVSLCKDTEIGIRCYMKSKDYKIRLESEFLNQEDVVDNPVFSRLQKMVVIKPAFQEHSIRLDASNLFGSQIEYSVTTNRDDIELMLEKNILKIRNKTKGPVSGELDLDIQALVKKHPEKNVQKRVKIFFRDTKIIFEKEFELVGTFQNQNDINKHMVFLEGKCEIRGSNGHLNQAFFIDIVNREKRYRFDQNSVSSAANFLKGVYTVKASLKRDLSYYQYQKEKTDNYRIDISCPDSVPRVRDMFFIYEKMKL